MTPEDCSGISFGTGTYSDEEGDALRALSFLCTVNLFVEWMQYTTTPILQSSALQVRTRAMVSVDYLSLNGLHKLPRGAAV
jgi:hypothetical protein